MPWHPALNQLRDALADLYPTEGDARRVVATAGLDDRLMSFYPSASNTWHSILEEAGKQGKIESIIQVAASEYPANAALHQATEAHRQRPPDRQQGAKVQIEDSSFPKHQGPVKIAQVLFAVAAICLIVWRALVYMERTKPTRADEALKPGLTVSVSIPFTPTPDPTHTPVPTDTPVPPTIVLFQVTPDIVIEGECSVLRWQVLNATEVSIEPSIGSASPSGSREVCPPTATIYYSLTAKGPGGISHAQVRVEVYKPTATPISSGSASLIPPQNGLPIWYVDIDHGTIRYAGQSFGGADFQFTLIPLGSAWVVVLQNGARVAKVGNSLGYEGCGRQQLGTANVDITPTELTNGQWFCAWTSESHVAEFWVRRRSGPTNDADFKWTVWQ